MDAPMKLVVNCETGDQTLEPLTKEEIKALEEQAIEAQARKIEQEAEENAKAEAKASALAKLTALGLTEDEAKAIVGA